MITALNGVIASSISSVSYDADAQLFFNAESAAGVTLSTTEKNAVNQWVIDSKAAGLWTKMKAVYPMVGSTATAQKFNLKNPLDTNAAYRLAFNGGWTHSSNGALPNGTNAYASTFLIPNTVFGSGYAAIGIYINQALTVGGARPMGSTNMDIVVNTTFVRGANKASTNTTVTATLSMDGFIVNSRVGAADTYIMNRNRTFVSSATAAVANYATASDIVLGANNSNGTIGSYSTGRIALAFCSDFLSQNESLLLYQITEKYQVALGRSVYPTQSFYYNSAYNNETNLFLFATQITDTTTQLATNTLVTDLKTAGIFTKIKAAYPMVGGTATTCKFNLINPQDTNAAYRLTFAGGWTYSANGALPNGTNAYADTYITPTANISLNNQHLSYYSRTSAMQSGTNYVMGSYNGGGSNVFALSISSGGTGAVSFINSTNAGSFSSLTHSNQSGFWMGNRPNSTANSHKLWKNGINVGSTPTITTGSLLINSIWLGALPNPPLAGYFGNAQCAFASIGDGLLDSEVANLYLAVQTFNTTLNRQV